MRSWLALLLLVVPAAAISAEPPVNLLQNPSFVSDGDRALLHRGGYRFDDGFVRMGQEAPLSKARLADVLAALRGVRPTAAAEAPKDLRDAPMALAAADASRVRVTIERVKGAWGKAVGDDSWTRVTTYEGPSGPALTLVAATMSGAGVSPAAWSPAGLGFSNESGGPVPFTLTRLSPAALEFRTAAGVGPVPMGAADAALAQGAPGAALGRPQAGQPPKAPPSPTTPPPPAPQPGPKAPAGRLASLFLSEDLLNAVVGEHVQTDAVKNLTLAFDSKAQRILMRGTLRVPLGTLRQFNIEDVKVPDFKFVMTIEPKTTKEGYLILVFPLQETYFWPAKSKDPKADRVVVPVQFLDLALASVRGYFGVLSGDYSAFDRHAAAIRSEIAALDKRIAATKDPELKAELVDDKTALDLALQGIPLERRRAERMAKKLGGVLAFVGEKEIRLNDQLSADKNTIVVKLKLDKLTPFLKGAQLGGIRFLIDTLDGGGVPMMAIDIVKAGTP